MDNMLNGHSSSDNAGMHAKSSNGHASVSHTSSSKSASSSATRSSLANGGNDSARVSELQSEVETMREQIRRLEAENKDLHRRLADAQTRRPSADGAGTGDAGTQQELKQVGCAVDFGLAGWFCCPHD